MTTSTPDSYADGFVGLRQMLDANVPAEILGPLDSDARLLHERDFAGGAPAPGEAAPMFELTDQHGTTVSLDALVGAGPVVLTFYRGEWCPYCNLHLRTYQAELSRIHGAGARLVAVSPQIPGHSRSTADTNELEFTVLSDPGNVVARAYGLVFAVPDELRDLYRQVGNDLAEFNGDSSWELPVPGTFVIDTERNIRFASIDGDYRTRAEVSDIVAALDAIH